MTQDNSIDQTLKQRRNKRLLALGGVVVVVAAATTATHGRSGYRRTIPPLTDRRARPDFRAARRWR